MSFRPRIVALLAIIAVALPLVACGKRAPPQPPPGEPDTYHKFYPNPNDQH
jgi:hypothetical protein